MFKLIPMPYKILGAAMIVLGAFVFGYMKGIAVGNQKLKLFEAKATAQYQELRAAYEKAKNNVNEKIVTEYVDKIIYVTKWRTKNVEVIKHVKDTCELSNGWVHVHDSSAAGRDADSSVAADDTSSGIEATEVLETVVDNYGACAANAEQVKAWQKWYTEQHVVVGKINRDNGVEEPASESSAPPEPYSSDDTHVITNNTGIIQR